MSSILCIVLPHNIIASDNEYYNKILQYGTDVDIATAFSKAGEDLGTTVNNKVLAVFNEKHSDKVYSSLVYYLSIAKIDGAEEVLKRELGREGVNDDYLEEVIHAIGEIEAVTCIEPLRELFHSERARKRVKMTIIDTWGKIGDLGVEDELITLLDTDYIETDIKARAILALGEIESKKSLALLKEILLNIYEKKILRMYAAFALSKIGKESVLDTLEEVLYDKSHEVAEYAVRGISEMECERCGEVLMKALRSDYDKVRYYAVVGLHRLEYEEALEILQFKAEYDSNSRVRIEAQKAVESLQKTVSSPEP